MRSSLLAAVAAAAGIAFASDVHAAAWTPPAAVRIVQKDTTSTRVFTSIQSAVSSCDGVTPCLVKVMPGTYDLGAATLLLKPYVTVEGSGPENTVITSANTTIASNCDNAVVMMADHSVLRQIKVVNKIPGAGAGWHANAVGFENVSARAEFVHAVSAFPANGVENGGPFRRIGVCVEAIRGHATADLDHVYAEGNNRGGQGNGVLVNGVVDGTVPVSVTVNVASSRIVGTSTDGSAYPINTDTWGGIATIVVHDSSLESNAGTTGDACGLWGGGAIVTVSNSRLSVTSYGASTEAIYADTSLRMTNSVITTNAPALFNVGGTVTIANSQLPGDRSALVGSGAKLVGNYDESFNPIPNQ